MGCRSSKATSTAGDHESSSLVKASESPTAIPGIPSAISNTTIASTAIPKAISNTTIASGSSRASTEKAAATAEDILSEVDEKIGMGDWAAAEQVLMRALENAVGYAQALWARLSSEARVREICLRSQRLQAGKMSLTSKAGSDWRPGPLIPVDFRKLCPSAPAASFEGVSPNVETRWRYTKDSITLQIMAELPAEHPVLKVPFAQGLFAMLGEIDLMHSWYPVISTKHPPNIHSNKADFLVYDNCVDVPFITRDQGLIEVHRFFLPNGIIVQRTQWVLDQEDARIKQMEKIRGYKLKDEPDLHTLIIAFGEEKSVVIITQENQQKSPPWPSVVETFISWIIPFMCRRMLSIGCGIFDDKEYSSRMQKDESGLYKCIRESQELGKKRERNGGAVFSLKPGGRRPEPEDLGAAGELIACVTDLPNNNPEASEPAEPRVKSRVLARYSL